MLIGEVPICDLVSTTTEMASRSDLVAVPWQYDENYLKLLDSPEPALSLAKVLDLSNEALARRMFRISGGLIGGIVTKTAIAAIRSGTGRISKASIDELRHVPKKALERRKFRPSPPDGSETGFWTCSACMPA